MSLRGQEVKDRGTTKTGRAHVIARLTSALDEKSLRRVWENIGITYQRHPDIEALKNRLKETLRNEGQNRND